MATLGKDLKGSTAIKSDGKGAAGAKKAAGGGARTTLLKAKLKAMEDGDVAKKLGEQSKRILQERFRTEDEASKTHAAKIEAAWMHILRMTTVGALRMDVELLAAQHERDCAHRDATLRMLFDDLMGAEEQYRVALFNHLRQMDRLIELQDARITDLEAAFDDELQQITNDFNAEIALIQQQHVLVRREMRSLVATITEQEEAKASEAEHAHVTAREEIRNRSSDRIQDLSRTLDERILELENAFEGAHVHYLHATDAKTESFKALVGDNAKAEKRIQRRAEAVERAKAALVSLRNKMAANSRDYEEKNELLALEKTEQTAHVSGLKARLDAFRASSDARLQKLSVAVRDSRARMDDTVSLASRILQTAERCRQLEGGLDKIWPVPIPDVAAGPEPGTILSGPGASSRAAAAALDGAPVTAGSARAGGAAAVRAATSTLTSGALVPLEATAARHGYVPRADGDAGTRAAALAATGDVTGVDAAAAAAGGGGGGGADSDDVAYADMAAAAHAESALMRATIESGELDSLDLFWRRFNKALLDKLVMERRRALLKAENDELRAMLAQCMAGTTLTDAAVSTAAGNPLIVINGRSGVTDAGAALMRTRDGGGGAATKIAIDAGVTVRAYAVQGKAV